MSKLTDKIDKLLEKYYPYEDEEQGSILLAEASDKIKELELKLSICEAIIGGRK